MEVRIYYEDTDAGGVVYHANYIKYLERARTEYFRDRGFLVAKLAECGFIFPVVRLEINFKAPAFHDDLMVVESAPTKITGASFTLCQRILRPSDGKLILEGLVTLVCTNPKLKAQRLPDDIRQLLESEMPPLSPEEIPAERVI